MSDYATYIASLAWAQKHASSAKGLRNDSQYHLGTDSDIADVLKQDYWDGFAQEQGRSWASNLAGLRKKKAALDLSKVTEGVGNLVSQIPSHPAVAAGIGGDAGRTLAGAGIGGGLGLLSEYLRPEEEEGRKKNYASRFLAGAALGGGGAYAAPRLMELIQQLKERGAAAADSVGDAAGDAVDAVSSTAQGVKDKVTSKAEDAMSSAGETMGDIANAANTAVDSAKGQAENAVEATKATANKATDAVSDAVNDAVPTTDPAIVEPKAPESKPSSGSMIPAAATGIGAAEGAAAGYGIQKHWKNQFGHLNTPEGIDKQIRMLNMNRKNPLPPGMEDIFRKSFARLGRRSTVPTGFTAGVGGVMGGIGGNILGRLITPSSKADPLPPLKD